MDVRVRIVSSGDTVQAYRQSMCRCCDWWTVDFIDHLTSMIPNVEVDHVRLLVQHLWPLEGLKPSDVDFQVVSHIICNYC